MCNVAAAEWPQFRGPTGQGISTATNVPIKWTATEKVAWKTPIPGLGWSSPVVAQGKVFLTSALSDGGKISLRALRIDAATGKIDWNNELFSIDAGAAGAMHKKNTLASPTPLVDGQRVFVHFGPNGTASLDLDGKILWKKNDIKYPSVHGGGGSPTLVGDALIFSCDGASDPFLLALDANTGAPKWKTPRNTHAKNTFSFSTALAITNAGGAQIISPTSGFVGAYNPANGAELWRVRYGEGYSVVPRPIFASGLVILSSGFDRPILHAIDPANAAIKWTISKGAPNTPSPVALGSEVFFVSDAGIASCADVATGEVHWSERLGGGFSASPIAAENRLYFVNESGVSTVLKASKKFEPLATNDLGERSLASPAALHNALLIRTENHLWKISSAN